MTVFDILSQLLAGLRGKPPVSPTSHQIGNAPTSLVLQRKDGTLVVNCPACVKAATGDALKRKGFQI